VRTLSMRHRLQIRILSAMNKEQTKKGASIAGLWVSSCFIDPSHVVFSLNRKIQKRRNEMQAHDHYEVSPLFYHADSS
jgi:hypothetical protein